LRTRSRTLAGVAVAAGLAFDDDDDEEEPPAAEDWRAATGDEPQPAAARPQTARSNMERTTGLRMAALTAGT
jgi:hypothetical protein